MLRQTRSQYRAFLGRALPLLMFRLGLKVAHLLGLQSGRRRPSILSDKAPTMRKRPLKCLRMREEGCSDETR